MNNFVKQWRASEATAEAGRKALLKKLDEVGIRYKIVHDEIIVDASPEELEAALGARLEEVLLGKLNVAAKIFDLLSELGCKYEIVNGIVYVLTPDGTKWDFTEPLVSTSKDFPEDM